jgi:hypothetical protein
MTEQQLREIFKPDRFGFCRVTMPDGKVQGFWFDTVLKVNTVIQEA